MGCVYIWIGGSNNYKTFHIMRGILGIYISHFINSFIYFILGLYIFILYSNTPNKINMFGLIIFVGFVIFKEVVQFDYPSNLSCNPFLILSAR